MVSIDIDFGLDSIAWRQPVLVPALAPLVGHQDRSVLVCTAVVGKCHGKVVRRCNQGRSNRDVVQLRLYSQALCWWQEEQEAQWSG